MYEPKAPKDELVELAVLRYLRHRNASVDATAVYMLNRLHEQVKAWDGSVEGMRFYTEYLLGEPMSCIASAGMARASVDTADFERQMAGPSVKIMVSQLFAIRQRAETIDDKLASALSDIRFYDRVVNLTNFRRGRPQQYVGRFLLSVFIECMTTIANKTQLEQTARLLGIRPEGVSFEKLQIQVRGQVEGALALLKLDDKVDWNVFNRAAVAYHIVSAAKEADRLLV